MSASSTAITAAVPDGDIAFHEQWGFNPGLLPGSGASFHTSSNIGYRVTLIFNSALLIWSLVCVTV